ncbi:MAG: FkbM family methyltransferase [Pseudomonadota bacterium]
MTDDPNPDTVYQRAKKKIAEARQDLVSAHQDLSALRGQIRHARSRGRVHQEVWNCERALGLRDSYFSQSGQDAFLEERIFRGKRDGTFFEIGGYDGVTGSNCLFFEMQRGWSGVVVEPSPQYHAACTAARRVPVLQLAIGGQTGKAEFLDVREGLRQMGGLVRSYDPGTRAQVEADPRHIGEVIQVDVVTLAELLDKHNLRSIDYLSLDVEGAEMEILSDFPFANYRIDALTVENRLDSEELPELLSANGFHRIEAVGVDDIYVSDPVLERLRD